MGARNIFGAFVIAIALFSFWPFVVGRYQQVGALREALAERQALVDERADALDNFQTELERFHQRVSGETTDKFAAMVPQHQGTAELVSALDAMANSTGIRLVKADISEPPARRGATTAAATLSISMDLEGRYESFAAFLRQLERSVRLLDIQRLQISEGRSPGELSIRAEMNAYFLR